MRSVIESNSGIPAQERRWIIRLTAAVCLLFTATITLADPDLWGHTFYGLRAIELGVLVETTDPYSYTAAGAPWVNHEWLTELCLGWLWSHFGNTGLVAWRVMWLLLLFLVLVRALAASGASAPAAVLLLVFTTETLADFLIFVRPQLATYAMFAGTLFLWRRHWDQPNRSLFWTIPMMALWTNLHGGFLAGIAIAGLCTVCAGIVAFQTRQWSGRFPGMAISLTGMLIVTFLNPWGWGLYHMLLEHLGTSQFVREWQPLWAVQQSPVYYVPFVLTAFALFCSRKWQWIDLILLALIGWQAASHLRHVALLAIAVAVLLPASLSEALSRIFPILETEWSAPAGRTRRLTALAAVFGLILVLRISGSIGLWTAGIGPWDIAFETSRQVPGMPVAAVSWMKDHQIQGNVLTDYGWGQFLIWHLFPESRVAFDGRYRTVYPPHVEREFQALQQIDPADQNPTPMLDSYPTEWALLPCGSRVHDSLKFRQDWVLYYDDGQSALFGRAESAAVAGSLPTMIRPESPNPRTRWTRFPGNTSARRLRP